MQVTIIADKGNTFIRNYPDNYFLREPTESFSSFDVIDSNGTRDTQIFLGSNHTLIVEK